MDRSLGMAARRESPEAALAHLIEKTFSENGTRRVSGADEQDVVGWLRHGRPRLAARRAGLHGDADRLAAWGGRRRAARGRITRRFLPLREDRNVVQRVEVLPGNALGIGDPVLL